MEVERKAAEEEAAKRAAEEASRLVAEGLGISNPLSRNNLGITWAHALYRSSGGGRSVGRFGEIVPLATYDMSQQLKKNPNNIQAAALSFAATIGKFAYSVDQSNGEALGLDLDTGTLYKNTRSCLQDIEKLFSGDSKVTAQQVRSELASAFSSAQTLLARDQNFRRDFENTVNALKAVDTCTQKNNIWIDDIGRGKDLSGHLANDSVNKDKLANVLISSLNSSNTQLTSVGSRAVSLFIALDSISEALDLYEEYSKK